MRGQANHARFCANALTIEPAVTAGRLYHLPAGFPAMIEADDGQVFGEAMTFPDIQATLELIDLLEGYYPGAPSRSMYVRRPHEITLLDSSSSVLAHAYHWNGILPKGSRPVACGHWKP